VILFIHHQNINPLSTDGELNRKIKRVLNYIIFQKEYYQRDPKTMQNNNLYGITPQTTIIFNNPEGIF
jgi:hypothetical protein